MADLNLSAGFFAERHIIVVEALTVRGPDEYAERLTFYLALPVTKTRLQEDETKAVQQACLFQIRGQAVAAIATTTGIQVWDTDTQQKLFNWNLCTAAAADSSREHHPASMCRGLALLSTDDDACLLCVGSDSGIIHTFEASKVSSIQHNFDIVHHKAPIAALTSGQISSSSVLASSDDYGSLTIFQAASACNFDVVNSWEGHGVPCVSVAIKGSVLIGAFYDGSVRLHNLVNPVLTPHLYL